MQHDQLDLTQQHQQSKKQAFVFIKAQFLITLLITAICLLFDVVVAYSALTGGTIAAVASAWFAYKVFRLSPDSAAESMVASAFMGEIYKVILYEDGGIFNITEEFLYYYHDHKSIDLELNNILTKQEKNLIKKDTNVSSNLRNTQQNDLLDRTSLKKSQNK